MVNAKQLAQIPLRFVVRIVHIRREDVGGLAQVELMMGVGTIITAKRFGLDMVMTTKGLAPLANSLGLALLDLRKTSPNISLACTSCPCWTM